MAVLPLMSFYGVPAYNKGNKIKFGGGGGVRNTLCRNLDLSAASSKRELGNGHAIIFLCQLIYVQRYTDVLLHCTHSAEAHFF